MIPAAYIPFFAACTGATGALIGLLFVAISIAPERTVGKSASPMREAMASNAFTALVNVFFITLVALIPAPSLAYAMVTVGAVSTLATLRLARHLFTGQSRSAGRLTLVQLIRRLFLVTATLVVYVWEVVLGGQQLWGRLSVTHLVSGASILIVTAFGIILVRMWSLLGARRNSILSWFSVIDDADTDQPA